MFFYPRAADGKKPGGITVSKTPALPEGDFGLTEYIWGPSALWFVDSDRFTADERQAAYELVADELPIQRVQQTP